MRKELSFLLLSGVFAGYSYAYASPTHSPSRSLSSSATQIQSIPVTEVKLEHRRATDLYICEQAQSRDEAVKQLKRSLSGHEVTARVGKESYVITAPFKIAGAKVFGPNSAAPIACARVLKQLER